MDGIEPRAPHRRPFFVPRWPRSAPAGHRERAGRRAQNMIEIDRLAGAQDMQATDRLAGAQTYRPAGLLAGAQTGAPGIEYLDVFLTI